MSFGSCTLFEKVLTWNRSCLGLNPSSQQGLWTSNLISLPPPIDFCYSSWLFCNNNWGFVLIANLFDVLQFPFYFLFSGKGSLQNSCFKVCIDYKLIKNVVTIVIICTAHFCVRKYNCIYPYEARVLEILSPPFFTDFPSLWEVFLWPTLTHTIGKTCLHL